MLFLLGIWRVEEGESFGEGPRAKPPQRPAGDLGRPGGAWLALPSLPVSRSGRGCPAER